MSGLKNLKRVWEEWAEGSPKPNVIFLNNGVSVGVEKGDFWTWVTALGGTSDSPTHKVGPVEKWLSPDLIEVLCSHEVDCELCGHSPHSHGLDGRCEDAAGGEHCRCVNPEYEETPNPGVQAVREQVAEEIAKAIEARKPHIPVSTDPQRRTRIIERCKLNEAARIAREIGGV